MKEIELLDAIGGARDRYLLDAQQCRENKVARRRSPVKIMLVAAIVAVLLAGCTYAVLRLQDLKMGEYISPIVPEEPSAQTVNGETTAKESTAPEVWDVLSVQGFAGSPGYLACRDWFEFETTYDQDLTLLSKSSEEGFQPSEAYLHYNCYTQEMVDKVNEICGKYDLKLLGKMWVVADIPQIFKAVGIDGVWAKDTKERFNFLESYCYEDGTFCLTGDIKLPERSVPIHFNIRNAMKGTFDYVKDIMQLETYTQWNYTMKDGSEVLLAIRDDHGMIIADREEFFASVRVSNCGFPEAREEAQKAMEDIVENFSFAYHPHQADTWILEDAQRQRDAEWDNQAKKFEEDYAQKYTRTGYEELIRDRLNDASLQNSMQYVLMDVNGDGEEELLLRVDGNLLNIFMMKDGHTDRGYENSWHMYGQQAKFCEGNIIVDSLGDEFGESYRFMRLEGSKLVLIESLDSRIEEPDIWYHHVKGENDTTKISEEEKQEIIDSYTPMELNWKPITEFPMN